jgi:multisubunit Na+/H+ antiporter MnhB subunit
MTPLVHFVSTLIFPMAFLIAVAHLLRAESGPGDGFTAGIICALALTLQYETRSTRDLPGWLATLRFERLLIFGLGIAAFAALLPIFFGENLLARLAWEIELPLVGPFKLARATLFDLGIALTVFGGAMTAIINLRYPEEEEE